MSFIEIGVEEIVFEPLNGEKNTLRYAEKRCIGCGVCSSVCPHGVFVQNGKKAVMRRYEACMECGACARNCPTAAIMVNSSVGCAAAMIRAALTGKGVDCEDLECC